MFLQLACKSFICSVNNILSDDDKWNAVLRNEKKED